MYNNKVRKPYNKVLNSFVKFVYKNDAFFEKDGIMTI